MAKWWQSLCLVMCVVAQSYQSGDDVYSEGVDAAILPESATEADADRPNSQINSGLRDMVQTGPEPQLPKLESEHPSQPMAPAARDEDRVIPPLGDRHPPLKPKSSSTDSIQERVQESEGQSENSQVSNSSSVFNALDSHRNEVGDKRISNTLGGLLLSDSKNTETVGNGQLPEDEAQLSHDVRSSDGSEREGKISAPGTVDSPLSNINAVRENGEESGGQAQKKQDADGYIVQNAGKIRTHEIDVGVLSQSSHMFSENDMDRKAENGQGKEGQVQNNGDGGSKEDLNSQSSNANDVDIGVLGNSHPSVRNYKPESEQKTETSISQVQKRVMDTSYNRSALPEDVKLNHSTNVSNGSGNMTAFSKDPAVWSGNGHPSENYGADRAREQPQQDKRPDQQDDDNEDDMNIPWEVYPLTKNTDKQIEGKSAGTTDDHGQEQGSQTPEKESDEEDYDFDGDYYEGDDVNDWWYYDPDHNKGDKGGTLPPSSQPSSIASTLAPDDDVKNVEGAPSDVKGAPSDDVKDGEGGPDVKDGEEAPDDDVKNGEGAPSDVKGAPDDDVKDGGGAPDDDVKDGGGAPDDDVKDGGGVPDDDVKDGGGAPDDDVKDGEGAPDDDVKDVKGAPDDDVKDVKGAPDDDVKDGEGAPDDDVKDVKGAPDDDVKDGEGAPDDDVKDGGGAPDDDVKDGGGAPDDDVKDGEGAPDDDVKDGGGAPDDDVKDGEGAPDDDVKDGEGAPDDDVKDGGGAPDDDVKDGGGATDDDVKDGGGAPDDDVKDGEGAPDDDVKKGEGASDDDVKDGEGAPDDDVKKGEGASDDDVKDGGGASDDDVKDGEGAPDDDVKKGEGASDDDVKDGEGAPDDVKDGEGAEDEKQGKKWSDIHEGVIEIADVMKKNKNMHGPKESILLYTGLIVILIAGIVIFTLWKNAAKMGGRPRNQPATVPTGEEGRRLLDHPFV